MLALGTAGQLSFLPAATAQLSSRPFHREAGVLFDLASRIDPQAGSGLQTWLDGKLVLGHGQEVTTAQHLSGQKSEPTKADDF